MAHLLSFSLNGLHKIQSGWLKEWKKTEVDHLVNNGFWVPNKKWFCVETFEVGPLLNFIDKKELKT